MNLLALFMAAATLVGCDSGMVDPGDEEDPGPSPPPSPPQNISDLPVASGQVPRWADLELPSAGGSYQDPTSGVRVWRVTDSSAPEAGYEWNHFNSASYDHVSLSYDGGTYHVIFGRRAGGRPWMVDFERGVGLSNYEDVSAAAVGTDGIPAADRVQFSRRDPHVAYFTDNDGVLHRYDAQTRQKANQAPFPKDFQADSRVTSVFGTDFLPVHFQTQQDDQWFSFRVRESSGEFTGVVAWNRETGEVCTYRDVPTRRHFQFEGGGWIWIRDGSDEMHLMDLSDCSVTAEAHLPEHPDGAMGFGVARAGRRLFRLDPETGTRTFFTEQADVTNGATHHSTRWLQTMGDISQWAMASYWDPRGDRVELGGFSQHEGEVYRTTDLSFNWVEDKVAAVHQTPLGSGRWLAARSSVSEMSEGTFHYDDASGTLYVWQFGGGDPTDRVRAYDPRAGFQGIMLFRLDGSEMRFVAHHWSADPAEFAEQPKATSSPDGRIILWTSNMNTFDGRVDVFLAELP